MTIHLNDDVDVSRGDLIVNALHQPKLSNLIEADLCWMDTRALDPTVTYLIQHNSKVIKCRIQEILHRVNINTLEKMPAENFQLNDIGRVIIKTAGPLSFRPLPGK